MIKGLSVAIQNRLGYEAPAGQGLLARCPVSRERPRAVGAMMWPPGTT